MTGSPMTDKVLRGVAGLAGVVFVSMGIGWWVAPSLLAEQLGMALLADVGRSTQIGDLASFFLTLGCCILAGLRTGHRAWLYASAMLLGLAAVGRVLAWALHGAALTVDLIAVETVLTGLLLVVSARLPPHPDGARDA